METRKSDEMTGKSNTVVNCIRCGESQHIAARTADLDAWIGGELIQNAMPYLSAGEREILISGVCETCFDNMFAGEEEDPIGDAETEYDIEFEGEEE